MLNHFRNSLEAFKGYQNDENIQPTISKNKMTLLYKAIYESAKLDLKAAKVLADGHLFPQSIYFFAQTFEKTTKSSIAFYLMIRERKTDSEIEKILRNTHGHGLIDSVISMQKVFMDKDKELYISRGGRVDDDFIKIGYNALDKIRNSRYPIDELIVSYNRYVKINYEKYYERLKEDANFSDKPWNDLRERYSNPLTRYTKYFTVASILFPLLKSMDIYCRYPTPKLNNNNIMLLGDSETRKSCIYLEEMVGGLIILVPLVLERIKSI